MTNESDVKLTPRSAEILESAAKIARSMNHVHIGVEHIFLAIIHDRHAVPTQVLADLIDLDRVESGLLGVLNSAAYSTPTRMVQEPDNG